MENYKSKKKKKLKFLKLYVKMEKIITKFGDIEIEKEKFHQYDRSTSIKKIDIDKIVVSNKVCLGKKGCKYFIGYKDAKK